jgi:hypothetical protein
MYYDYVLWGRKVLIPENSIFSVSYPYPGNIDNVTYNPYKLYQFTLKDVFPISFDFKTIIENVLFKSLIKNY